MRTHSQILKYILYTFNTAFLYSLNTIQACNFHGDHVEPSYQVNNQ